MNKQSQFNINHDVLKIYNNQSHQNFIKEFDSCQTGHAIAFSGFLISRKANRLKEIMEKENKYVALSDKPYYNAFSNRNY